MTSAPDHRPVRTTVWIALDVALILVFALLGRASHHEGISLTGVFLTALPFLAAYSLVVVSLLAWRRPSAVLRTAVPLWAGTVIGGLVLRVATGESAALAFQIVSAIVLGLFLVVPRAVNALYVRRRRTQSPLPHSPSQNQGAVT